MRYPKYEDTRKEGSKHSASEKVKLLLTSTIFRPWQLFCTEIIVGSFALYVGINFAIYYSFFAAFPYVFLTVYNFNLGSRGLIFLGLAVGNLFAFLIVVLLNRLIFRKRARTIAAGQELRSPPEKRLLLALLGSVFVPIGLFWFGWSAKPSVHWICPIIGSGVFAFGNFLVFVSRLGLYITRLEEILIWFLDVLRVVCCRCLWTEYRRLCDCYCRYAAKYSRSSISVVHRPE